MLDDVLEKSKIYAKKRIEKEANLKMRLYKVQKEKEKKLQEKNKFL